MSVILYFVEKCTCMDEIKALLLYSLFFNKKERKKIHTDHSFAKRGKVLFSSREPSNCQNRANLSLWAVITRVVLLL
jgi:hypothetical protein